MKTNSAYIPKNLKITNPIATRKITTYSFIKVHVFSSNNTP